MQFRNIVVPIDFSAHSLHALQVACGLAVEDGSALHLLHVWQPGGAFTASSPPAVILAAQEQTARARLQEIHPTQTPCAIRRFLGTGAPADEVLRLAEAHCADLIVMGAYGLTGKTPWTLGSVAEAVLRRAECPVLTCKVPTELLDRHDGRHTDGASARQHREVFHRAFSSPEEV